MRSRILFLTLALAVAIVPSRADEVQLANGDRISGEVVSKSGTTLTVRTTYAGEIAIRWNEVARLTTASAVEVMVQGASVPFRALIQAGPGDSGTVRLVPEDGGAVLEVGLQEIAYVNPKPYESGFGTDYSGRATLSAAYASGNVESNRLYGDADLTARAKAYRYGVSAKVERRIEAAGGSDAAWLLGANYDRFLGEKRFAYVRGSVEHDRARDIDRRSALGLGFGSQLLDTPAAQLTVRGGLDYVAVDRFTGESDRYPALGWGVKATYAPWGPRLQWFHDHEGFWNLEDTTNVVVRSKTGLRVPLVERLNATAQLNVDWERSPAPGRVPTDRTLLLGVDYTF